MTVSAAYSVIRRWKKWAASEAATARMATDQINEASMGCCIGQACTVAEGFGFPQSWRAAAVTALTGFQLAMACNQPGMCRVGHHGVRDEGQREQHDEVRTKPPTPGSWSSMPTHAATHASE